MFCLDDDDDGDELFCENCGDFGYEVENCEGCGELYCINCIDWHIIEDCPAEEEK